MCNKTHLSMLGLTEIIEVFYNSSSSVKNRKHTRESLFSLLNAMSK